MNFQGFDALLYSKSGNSGVEGADFMSLMTGFSPSSGAVVLNRKKSALFVDGRYTLEAKQSVNLELFEILDLKKTEIVRWIKSNIPANSAIAYDPLFFTINEIVFFKSNLNGYKFTTVDLKSLFGASVPRRDLKIQYLQNEKEDKLSCVYDVISANNLDAYLVCDPCSSAWLLNIRDLENKYTPVVLCQLLITKEHEIFLYVDESYNIDFTGYLKPAEKLAADLSKFSKVGIDESEAPSCITHGNLIHVKNPCLHPKALKSQHEIENIKSVSKRDSAAIVNFLHWFHTRSAKVSELDVVEKILYFRKLQKDFIGESFATIAAADENAAVVHYSPNDKTNKLVENILLLDSGGQYKFGTTDITRTVALLPPSQEQKLFYTLVLKGHIALANAKFPVGTTGAQLDSLARQFLWQYSRDYNHATGHGIGYMSQIHEPPIGISQNSNLPLQAGMILSNEPGYYQENSFGVRLENMMLVREELDNFLFFETVSLVPFDTKFINKSLLSPIEIKWLNEYHTLVISALDLPNNVTSWLREYTKL